MLCARARARARKARAICFGGWVGMRWCGKLWLMYLIYGIEVMRGLSVLQDGCGARGPHYSI